MPGTCSLFFLRDTCTLSSRRVRPCPAAAQDQPAKMCGALLIMPAILAGAISGTTYGFLHPGWSLKGCSLLGCVLGALTWSLHRSFPADIGTEGPGACEHAGKKAVLCGFGTALMTCGTASALSAGAIGEAVLCGLVMCANAVLEARSPHSLNNGRRGTEPFEAGRRELEALAAEDVEVPRDTRH